MSHIIDIGGAPAEEECAQLGQTIDFGGVQIAFDDRVLRDGTMSTSSSS